MEANSETNIGAFEAKTHLSQLLERVEAGEAFIITRHGKPVARLAAAQTASTSREALIKTLAELKALGLRLGGQNNWDDWKQDRDNGRR